MKELKPVEGTKNVKMRIFYDFEPGDRLSIDDEEGITREEFHALIKKASQPIKREAESDSEKSET